MSAGGTRAERLRDSLEKRVRAGGTPPTTCIFPVINRQTVVPCPAHARLASDCRRPAILPRRPAPRRPPPARHYKSALPAGARRRGITLCEGRPMHAYRTHTCGQLRLSDAGKTVRLSGWVHRKRDHGQLLFVDLRDNYGVTQVVVDSGSPMFAKMVALKLESVVTV